MTAERAWAGLMGIQGTSLGRARASVLLPGRVNVIALAKLA
jgi:hypothetical protein